MSETEVISRRRALSFLGLAALATAVPAAILPISEAEAQQPSPPAAPPAGSPPAGSPPAGPQTGTDEVLKLRQFAVATCANPQGAKPGQAQCP